MGDDVDADGTAWARACAADAVRVNMARGWEWRDGEISRAVTTGFPQPDLDKLV